MKACQKSNIILSAFLLILFAVGSTKGQQRKNTETIIIKTNIYCDHCFECRDCGGKLMHELSFEKGVKMNKVDPKEMTITITYSSEKTTPEKLRRAISKLGYDADEIKADTTAYSKFDECCKKK